MSGPYVSTTPAALHGIAREFNEGRAAARAAARSKPDPLPADEALLNMSDLAARLHVKGAALRRVVEESAALRSGRRYRGTRAYFTRSSVVKHIHIEMSGAPS